MSSQLAPTEATQSSETTTPPTATGDSDEMGAEPLSLDLVFEVLKNERRRRVLAYLRENDDTVSLSDVAEHIAAVENEKPETALSSQERKRVYVGLYPCHQPKIAPVEPDVDPFALLAGHRCLGFFVLDGNRGTVELGDNAEQLYPFLEAEADQRRPWPSYY